MIKKLLVILIMIMCPYGIASADGPKVTQSPDWKFIINNAYRAADEYAIKHNPSATFACPSKNFQLVKQLAGKYKGKYLLMITCESGRNTSFAVLQPNFDVNTPAGKLNDDDPNLWKIIKMKFNGREF